MQGGTNGDVDACNAKYGVTFPEFAIDHVTGPNAEPVFKWLEMQPNQAPYGSPDPSWNFNKYLISRDGQLMGHWDSTVYWGTDPMSATYTMNPVVMAIETEIAKPKP